MKDNVVALKVEERPTWTTECRRALKECNNVTTRAKQIVYERLRSDPALLWEIAEATITQAIDEAMSDLTSGRISTVLEGKRAALGVSAVARSPRATLMALAAAETRRLMDVIVNGKRMADCMQVDLIAGAELREKKAATFLANGAFLRRVAARMDATKNLGAQFSEDDLMSMLKESGEALLEIEGGADV